jgi:hypothetical protein
VGRPVHLHGSVRVVIWGDKFYLSHGAWASVRVLIGELDESADGNIDEVILWGWQQVKANGLVAFKRNRQRASFEK